MDVPSGWVQIIRGPRPLSQRGPKSHEQKPSIGRWRTIRVSAHNAPPGSSGTSSSPGSCKEQDRSARACIGSDGWHGGAGSAEGTDFGQSRFSHPELTNFGQSNCGQSIFGSGVCHVPKGWGPNPEKIGPRRVGPPKGGGPKFRVFFFRLPPVSFFLSLTVCLLVVFWWCLEAPGPSNVHVWSSGVVV